MRRKKILVIDDDASLCELLMYLFAREGAQVYTASSGPEGLRQFCACQPDLVILDIMMPKVDGWQTCTDLLQLAKVPIIFLSALRGEAEIRKGLGLGAVDYITKPFKPKILVMRATAAMRGEASVASEEEPG